MGAPGPAATCPPWVVVAWARHEPEADLIVNLLHEHGIAAYHRRGLGVDVPDFLAMGQRVVLVPADQHDMARELLEPGALAPDNERDTAP